MTNDSDSKQSDAKREPHVDDLLPSLRAVARRLAVHPSTVSGWLARGCPGPDGDGLYDLAAVELWLADRAVQRIDSDELGEDYAALVRARADEREHLAAIAELERKELEAQYVPVSWVRARAELQGVIVRREVGALIDRLAPRLVGVDAATARAIFKDEARRTLAAIAEAKE
jgi:hypothetical protein